MDELTKSPQHQPAVSFRTVATVVDAVTRSLGRLTRLLGPTALVAFCLLSFAAKTLAATYHCSSAGGVTTAMSNAQPGDILILAAGSYGSMTFSGNGSEGNPITLRAERHGAVTLTGQLAVSGSWLTADGFTLTGAGWITIAGHHHRITNMDVNGSSAAKWVQLDSASQYCEIDHCLFRNKSVAGQLLQLRGSSSSAGHYHSIHHNYFRDFAYGGGANGWETIQFGQGATSTSTWSANTVASNLFFQCDGEGEIVSAKNSGNTFLGNVFRKCRGKLVIRQGHGCRMEGNYFFGDGGVNTGGIRISGQNHEIVNNTFHDLSGKALDIKAGTVPWIDKAYLPVTNALVAFNTFAACANPVKIGSGHSTWPTHEPPEYTMANNVLFDTSGTAITYDTNNMAGDPVATYEGNVVHGGALGLDPVPSGIDTNTAPDMVVCTNEAGNRYPGWIFAPDSDSPLVDAATGTYASVTSDLFGTMRVEPKDIGAVEGTTNAPLRLPVTTNDVGPVPIFVHAGADAACFATYTLTGSVVDMGLAGGAGLTNEWVLLDGDGDVLFDDASSVTTRVTFAQGGTYVLRLTAWSGSTTNSDEITLVVDYSLSIVNTGASGVTSNSADLVGLLNCPNRELTVTVYWSTNDHADASAWLGDAQSMEIGTYSNFTGQAVTGSVSSLTPNATYYYTMAATNGATNIWASPNVSFSTAALVITVTENGGNVDFAWNGIIGASGTTITGTSGGSADQIVPIDGQVQVANGHTNFSEGQWYAGTASACG